MEKGGRGTGTSTGGVEWLNQSAPMLSTAPRVTRCSYLDYLPRGLDDFPVPSLSRPNSG